MSAGAHIRFRMCLVVGLFIIIALQTALAICPLNCSCHVYGNKHMANCIDRGFKTLPSRGSDMYDFLELSDNKLKRLPDDGLSIFPIVQILNLSQNAISELTPGSFRGLTYLDLLDLSYNSLRLEHSIDKNFLAEHRVTWLSLAGNVDIGKELERSNYEDEVNKTAWLNIPSLRTLILSNCRLTRIPRWLVRGLPGIETLDVSSNQILVLPVMTLVTTCRLRHIGLASNRWRCPTAGPHCDNENTRAHFYLETNSIDILSNYSFCPSSAIDGRCDLILNQGEEFEKSLCHNKSVPERIVYAEPPSLWFYIGIVAGSIVGLVFLSLLINAVCSSMCKKNRTTAPIQSKTDTELLPVYDRS